MAQYKETDLPLIKNNNKINTMEALSYQKEGGIEDGNVK